jgi:hypothetical protein
MKRLEVPWSTCKSFMNGELGEMVGQSGGHEFGCRRSEIGRLGRKAAVRRGRFGGLREIGVQGGLWPSGGDREHMTVSQK